MEVIRQYASQGSSLTMIGLFQLDEIDGSLKATKLTHILSGGLREARRCFQQRIDLFNEISLGLFFSGLMWLGIARRLHHLKRLRESKLRLNNLQPQPAIRLPNQPTLGTPECIVCYENVATVVSVPCNHLISCRDCHYKLVQEGWSRCFLCNIEIDIARCFELQTQQNV